MLTRILPLTQGAPPANLPPTAGRVSAGRRRGEWTLPLHFGADKSRFHTDVGPTLGLFQPLGVDLQCKPHTILLLLQDWGAPAATEANLETSALS